MGYFSKIELHVVRADHQDISDELAKKIWLCMGDVDKAHPGLYNYLQEMFGCYDGEPDTFYDDKSHVLTYYVDGGVKWYEGKEAMTALSKLLPELIFRIHRDGEIPSDIADEYYMNGEMIECPWKPVQCKWSGDFPTY